MATSSPDDLFGDAAFVARSVGATNAVAFDLTAACSGFLFGINTASQFLHNGAYKTAIVIGADALSRWVDWTDRNTCVLFGDGAGAVVLQQTAAGQPAGILGYEMHSNGAGRSDLNLGYNGESKDLGTTIPATVTNGAYTPIAMNGKEVYKFATTCVPEVLKEALDNAGLTADDVDWLLLHQVRAVAHQRARAHSTSSLPLPCAPNDCLPLPCAPNDCLPHRIPRLPSLSRVFTPSPAPDSSAALLVESLHTVTTELLRLVLVAPPAGQHSDHGDCGQEAGHPDGEGDHQPCRVWQYFGRLHTPRAQRGGESR